MKKNVVRLWIEKFSFLARSKYAAKVVLFIAVLAAHQWVGPSYESLGAPSKIHKSSEGSKKLKSKRPGTPSPTATPTPTNTLPPGSPVLTWSPLTKNFGNIVQFANSADEVFRVTNSGTGAATGCSAPTLAGMDPTEFDIVSHDCLATIAGSGGYCEVILHANPQNMGLQRAHFSITCTTPAAPATTTTNEIRVIGVGGPTPTHTATPTPTATPTNSPTVTPTATPTPPCLNWNGSSWNIPVVTVAGVYCAADGCGGPITYNINDPSPICDGFCGATSCLESSPGFCDIACPVYGSPAWTALPAPHQTGCCNVGPTPTATPTPTVSPTATPSPTSGGGPNCGIDCSTFNYFNTTSGCPATTCNLIGGPPDPAFDPDGTGRCICTKQPMCCATWGCGPTCDFPGQDDILNCVPANPCPTPSATPTPSPTPPPIGTCCDFLLGINNGDPCQVEKGGGDQCRINARFVAFACTLLLIPEYVSDGGACPHPDCCNIDGKWTNDCTKCPSSHGSGNTCNVGPDPMCW